LDNGNPADHDSMKSNTRKVFNGLALAIIQSKNQSGVIRIKVSSLGLKESAFEIIAQRNVSSLLKVEDLKK
jgi:beta-galactosidase